MNSLHFRRCLWAIILLIVAYGAKSRAQLNTNDVSSADPRTLLLLALQKAGGEAQSSGIKDFVAHGTIVYGQPGPNSRIGRVTLNGQGDDRFRMDSEFDDGGRASWSVNDHNGQYKSLNTDKPGSIPSYNAMNEGWLTLPYMRLATALQDPNAEFRYLGLQPFAGSSAHEIRIIRHLSKQEDPQDLLSGLRTADYFLSTADLTIIGIADSIHPSRAAIGMNSRGHVLTVDIPRAIYYSDFHIVNGVPAPFSVTEVIKGQPIWSLKLVDIAFNVGHGDSDFILQ